MANLSNFVGALKDGGARANQFEVQISGAPSAAQAELNSGEFRFLCQGASVPALTLGEVTVPYRGRQVFVAGDRTYDAWTVTCFNDRSYGVRSHLESWMNNMGDIGAATTAQSLNASGYYATAIVAQKDRNDATIRSYTLDGVWPTTIDAIDLAYDTNDAIMEFGITMRFNSMVSSKGGGTP